MKKQNKKNKKNKKNKNVQCQCQQNVTMKNTVDDFNF